MTPTLTPAEVAAWLRVGPDFVYRHWKELGGAKLGDSKTSRLRFRPEAIEQYIREREAVPIQGTGKHVCNGYVMSVSHVRRFAARRRQGRVS